MPFMNLGVTILYKKPNKKVKVEKYSGKRFYQYNTFLIVNKLFRNTSLQVIKGKLF